MSLNSPENQSSIRKTQRPRLSQRRRDGCTECRRKKVKCDLRKPVCSRCKRYPRGCIYNLSVVQQSPLHLNYQESSIERQNQQLALYSPPQRISALRSCLYQPTLNLSPFLASEESRFFMHVFSTETAPRLFPAAPDFFLQRMISASIQTPHLLYALLAAACSHHGRLIRDSTPNSTLACLKFTNKAISSLRLLISNSQYTLDPQTVTAAMALCTNDVCNGNMDIWRTHLCGTMQLLNCLLRKEKASDAEELYVNCLAKWFMTMDVLAGLSGIRPGCVHDAGSMPLIKISTLNSTNVDDICGYSLDLMPTLARISKLALRHHTYMHTGDQVPQDIVRETEILESTLYSIVGRTVSNATRDSHGELAEELQQTHHAFVYSALLHLHRRIQRLPKYDPKVITDIKNILDAVLHIRPLSAANILILWPIFSAGCETDSVSQRNLIQDRMNHMQSFGMGNFTRAKQLLKSFWASNTPLPWDIYFANLGKELVLF
ncbi:fungal-specific transcription factor domain-containing protein [Aspergillus ambiguus]|uniref:transcription factor domain-containing protein n=1 Tax=Aspergillus ambiguus TaxID=176160 RepID=UPI003CCCB411